MKVLEKKYPKGSLKYQKSDGRYIDDNLYENLEFLGTRIVDDMTFLGICFSSTLEVGTGKSVCMTQIGEVWTDIINRMHGLNLKFTQKNIVWRPKDLIERSFELPKYSCIILDEWEDDHYWSVMGKTLRQYFRKCRQQNLFIIVIIPNFFQMNIGYAINRSVFAIDVKFAPGLKRGLYEVYDFDAKKKLYIKGKKYHDYKCVSSTFKGVFGDGYGIDRGIYLKAKKEDLKRWDTESEDKIKPEKISRNERIECIRKFIMNEDLIASDGLNTKTISKIFNINLRTSQMYVKEAKEKFHANEHANNYIIKEE